MAVHGCVLVVGPDGCGKSTLADALVARADGAGIPVERVHWRPGATLPKRSVGPVVEPHAQEPDPLVRSGLKAAAVTADFLAAAAGPWRQARRNGLLVVERGWGDMAVDPLRYRLDARGTRLARRLARLVPKADVVLLLTGDPAALHARKPELGVDEIAAQLAAWRALAPDVGAQVVELDTTAMPIDAVASLAWEAIAASTPAWRLVPFVASRVDLRVREPVPVGSAVYRPQRRAARVAAVGADAVMNRGLGRRVPPPVPNLDKLLADVGVPFEGLSSMRSSAPGRVVVGVHDGAGRLRAVAKIGTDDDGGLHREAEVLRRPLSSTVGLSVPSLVWAGEWDDRFVVVTDAVTGAGAGLDVPTLVDVCTALVNASLVHGDMAPWNVAVDGSGPVLLDWEASRDERAPLFDFTHYLVQEGALLGRRTPAETVRLLTDAGGPGAVHLAGVGHDPVEARGLVSEYLRRSADVAAKGHRYRNAVGRLVA